MSNFFKKNWLVTLLIIFFLAFGVFAYQWWRVKGELGKQIEQNENLIRQIEALQKEIKDKKAEVTILTEKPEYNQGEEVKISVDYDGDLYVWDYPWSPWSVQRKVNDSWIDLKLGFTTFGFSACEIECKDIPLNKTVDCVICQLEAPAWDLINGRDISFTWNQKHITSLGTYQCYQRGKIVSQDCVIYEEVPPGEYKIRFEYALNIKNRMTKEGANIKYAEKKLRIVK